ncbi:MAG TPA: protein kinase, partial [Thermoanaerobaculia bacterium]|nr:protein kinase [Thermoanaerobaculia bacterium]
MQEPRDLTALYQLKQLLNWTASARTFSGTHPTSGEPVAVKLLSLSRAPAVDELGRRFENIARVLQALGHPALPHVLEYGLTPTGDAFLVTRWIEGTPLPTDQTIEPAKLLPMVLQVVGALETVSLHGIAHLNLTPDNVLVQADGTGRLLGWGTSLLTVDWQSAPTERVDSGPASPWSAPELMKPLFPGGAPWRADLYSVALICTQLLGAQIESRGDAAPSVRFDKALSGRIKQPEKLRQVLESCLRRAPKERPDTYAVLAQAIQHAMPRGESPKETRPVGRVDARRPLASEDATASQPAPSPPVVAPPEEAPPAAGRDRVRTVLLTPAIADVTGTRPRPATTEVAPPPPEDDDAEAATVVGMKVPDLRPRGAEGAEPPPQEPA